MPDQRLIADDEGRVLIEFNGGGELELCPGYSHTACIAEVLEPPELNVKSNVTSEKCASFTGAKKRKKKSRQAQQRDC
jgi:hypothetical protein